VDGVVHYLGTLRKTNVSSLGEVIERTKFKLPDELTKYKAAS
jgi:hypothetical protein